MFAGKANIKSIFICCIQTQNFQTVLVAKKNILVRSLFQKKGTILGEQNIKKKKQHHRVK